MRRILRRPRWSPSERRCSRSRGFDQRDAADVERPAPPRATDPVSSAAVAAEGDRLTGVEVDSG